MNYNNNLVIIAENVGQFAVNITAEAYLANANNLIRNSKMDIVQIDNSFPKVTINEKDFHVMNLVTFVKGMHVHQTYLVTIDKGFALGFIYSYIDDAQKTEIEKAINSIRPYKKSSSS